MTDIVERLNADADRRFQYALVLSNMREPLKDNDEGRTVVRLREAAAEITRLRAEAEALRNTCSRVAADAMFHELATSVRYAVIDATTKERDATKGAT